jgi:hypothetical protein
MRGVLWKESAHARAPQAEHAPPGGADHDRRRAALGTALGAEGALPLLSPACSAANSFARAPVPETEVLEMKTLLEEGHP